MFERDGEGYAIAVHVAGGTTLEGSLEWDDTGASQIAPSFEPAWVDTEAHKLARVLKRTGQDKLLRWRPEP